MNPEAKRQAMNAMNHNTTAAHRTRFLGANSPTVRATHPRAGGLEAKQQLMEAVSHVKGVVAQAGWAATTMGVAAYIGRIREVDREMQMERARRSVRTVQRQGIERLE